MKRIGVLSLVFAFLGLMVFAGEAIATPSNLNLNWGSQVNPAQCPAGNLVINVTFKVLNDGDTRVGGGFWAFDNYTKYIQVLQLGDGSFCADVRYVGSFTTLAGASPQGSDPAIAAGIKGTFEGGYIATFSGTLAPTMRTMGNIGTFDYGCLAGDPGDYSTCTGLFSWMGAYFSSTADFDQPWWGWIYRTSKNGTWINAVSGNQGDITD